MLEQGELLSRDSVEKSSQMKQPPCTGFNGDIYLPPEWIVQSVDLFADL